MKKKRVIQAGRNRQLEGKACSGTRTMIVFCVILGFMVDICVFILSAECPSSLYSFSITVYHITPELSSLKQCIFLISQLLWVRLVGMA